MPVASIARPIKPPSASISRTRWPFADPPTAGLHGMWATVSLESVQRPTCAPRRAAAYAASHPACPAPTTMTSYVIPMLLSDAELRENVGEQIVARPTPRNLLEGRSRVLQICEDE